MPAAREAPVPDSGAAYAPRGALSAPVAVAVAVAAFLFLVLCYVPLRPTDLWVHVNWGGFILDQGILPLEDPFQPLAAGMEVVDPSWLSQVVLAGLERAAPPEALSVLFAVTSVGTYLVLGLAYRRIGGGGGAAAAGVAAAFIVGWSRLTTVRPENFAALAFALLLLVVGPLRQRDAAGHRVGLGRWAGVALLMALWANLHGSFPVGVALLGCLALGAAIDRFREGEGGVGSRLAATFADRGVMRRIWLAELGAAATLVNPYGGRVWLEVLAFGENPNLPDLVEWRPMAWGGPGSLEMAISVAALVALYRASRRTVAAAEWLLLAAFGFAALDGVRMLAWYAPIFGLVVARHAAGLVRHRRTPLPRRYVWTAVAAVAVWLAVALSPVAAPLLGGAHRTAAEVYGPSTPLGAAGWLAAHPPGGQIYNPQWWGDFLVYSGPPGLAPFVTSNVHLVPPRVWSDYRRISEAQAGWERALDRYATRLAVVDSAVQGRLAAALRASRAWHPVYRDAQAEIFARRPAEGAVTPPEGASGGASTSESVVAIGEAR